MVNLNEIDLKLQNSFANIKKDMDSFRNTLETQDERIKELEREFNSLPGYKELEKLKEGLNDSRTKLSELSKKQSNEVLSITEKIQNLRDDFVLKEEFEALKPKDFEEEIDAIKEKLSELTRKVNVKKDTAEIDRLSLEIKEIKRELEKKTKETKEPKEEAKKEEKKKKEKKEEPKEETKEGEEEKPKKKIFDKVIDFFAEEE